MSSLLATITDVDLRRWQQQRYALLGEILKYGDSHDLPPLTWRVDPHSLIGEAHQLDMGERRAAFGAWLQSLEMMRWNDNHSVGGLVHLRATRVDLWGRAVDLVVTADIFHDLP